MTDWLDPASCTPRATALVARAVIDPRWHDVVEREGLLAPAMQELDAAAAICAAPGIVSTTFRDVEAFPIDDPAVLVTVGRRLGVVERAREVESVTPAVVPNDAPG